MNVIPIPETWIDKLASDPSRVEGFLVAVAELRTNLIKVFSVKPSAAPTDEQVDELPLDEDDGIELFVEELRRRVYQAFGAASQEPTMEQCRTLYNHIPDATELDEAADVYVGLMQKIQSRTPGDKPITNHTGLVLGAASKATYENLRNEVMAWRSAVATTPEGKIMQIVAEQRAVDADPPEKEPERRSIRDMLARRQQLTGT